MVNKESREEKIVSKRVQEMRFALPDKMNERSMKACEQSNRNEVLDFKAGESEV